MYCIIIHACDMYVCGMHVPIMYIPYSYIFEFCNKNLTSTKITIHIVVYSYSPWPATTTEIVVAAYNYKDYPP